MEQENLNKNKSRLGALLQVIPWLIIGVLGTLLITKSCPGSANQIKTELNQALEPIKTKLTTIEEQEIKRLAAQQTLENFRQEVMKELPAIKTSVNNLTAKLAARPAPENPQDFKTLPECQEKYDTLKESYTICLDLDKSREEQLNLFWQVYENLINQKTLLEGAVKDLQDQVKGYKDIEKKVTESMDKLDRAYSAGRSLRDMKYVALGVAASAVTIAVITLIKALKK
jgi:chromosome segregation ATPase